MNTNVYLRVLSLVRTYPPVLYVHTFYLQSPWIVDYCDYCVVSSPANYHFPAVTSMHVHIPQIANPLSLVISKKSKVWGTLFPICPTRYVHMYICRHIHMAVGLDYKLLLIF